MILPRTYVFNQIAGTTLANWQSLQILHVLHQSSNEQLDNIHTEVRKLSGNFEGLGRQMESLRLKVNRIN